MEEEFQVYILFSEKLNRFYTGCTSKINLRLDFHQNAEAHKFTAKAKDWEMYVSFSCKSKSQILAIERHIKSMKNKIYIQNLKKYPEMILKLKERFC